MSAVAKANLPSAWSVDAELVNLTYHGAYIV